MITGVTPAYDVTMGCHNKQVIIKLFGKIGLQKLKIKLKNKLLTNN